MFRTRFLQTHALFGGLNDEEMRVVRPHLKEERFAQGATIIREGEQGDRVYFLVKGSVEVLKADTAHPGAPDRRLALLQSGESFGEMELIDIQPRSATVRSLEDVTVLSLSNGDLYALHKICPNTFTMIVMNMAREISRRLRRMDAAVSSALYASGAATPAPAPDG